MITVLSCITTEHDFWLVVLAGTLCAFGSWVTARLYHYARTRPRHRAIPWNIVTACIAGVSIWCTHFVAMLGYRSGAPVEFDLGLTAVSLGIAILGSAAGLTFPSFVKTRHSALIGGAVLGLAIAGMHYAGMIAYRVQGIVTWNSGYLIASILLSVMLSAVALMLGRQDRRHSELLMASILTLAIVSLHFTGMTAFNVSPLVMPGEFVNPEAFKLLAIAITGTAALIVVGGFLSYALENRIRLESIKELTEARNAAESASQAKSEFMSVLSHELRTPLTIIMGYASILRGIKEVQAKSAARKGVPVDFLPNPVADQAELYGTKISTSAEHLLSLINEILDYTGMELGETKLAKSAFTLSGLLADVSDQFQVLAQNKGVLLETDCPLDIIVYADRGRLLQILINLIGNALKFSRADLVRVRANRTEKGFEISVEDNGKGIPEEALGRIFQAFTQVEAADNRSEGGTGLGLAICKKLAQAHGGEITVKSVLASGTTFTLTLPPSALAAPGTPVEEAQLTEEIRLAS